MSTKEKVLNELYRNKGIETSGEQLAKICGVSRTAIWKAVNTLRQEGHSITGTTKGGYLLSENANVFSDSLVKEYISSNFPELSECRLECFKEIDSTNTYAKRLLAENGNLRDSLGNLTDAGKKFHKSVVIAESQTAGRGRLGRSFISPLNTGIYITLIYAPEGGVQNPARMTACSAVGVCRAIENVYGVKTSIKWINDIFSENGKKVCGILTEGFTNFESGLIESAIIGIGINICENPSEFPEEVAKVAGAILSENSGNSKRHELAGEVAGQVLKVLEEDPAEIIKEYREKSFLIGHTVQVYPVIGDESKAYKAKVIDVDNNAALVVELENKEQRTLISGEVTLKSENIINS